MRFAVLSEIQAHAHAFEAVLLDIDGLPDSVDRIVSAGDNVGLGPNPNEVLSLIRERGIEALMGNYDDAVVNDRLNSGVDFASAEAEEIDQLALAWTRAEISDDNLRYLRELPRDVRLFPMPRGTGVKRDELQRSAGKQGRDLFVRSMFGGLIRSGPSFVKKVLVVHGSPRALNEHIREDSANSILTVIRQQSDADLLVTGHAGEAFRHDAVGMIFVGAGSVSGPYAVPGEARYAVVDLRAELNVEFRSVLYSRTATSEAIARSGLPAALGDRFRVQA